jgi:hypothetical protein
MQPAPETQIVAPVNPRGVNVLQSEVWVSPLTAAEWVARDADARPDTGYQ